MFNVYNYRIMPIGLDKDMIESTGMDKKLAKVMLNKKTE